MAYRERRLVVAGYAQPAQCQEHPTARHIFSKNAESWSLQTQAAFLLVQAPEHVISQWGLIHVVQADGAVVCLKEKELSSKLELLYNKSLYMLALNLAQSQQVHA